MARKSKNWRGENIQSMGLAFLYREGLVVSEERSTGGLARGCGFYF